MTDARIPGTASEPAPEPVATLEAAARILATTNRVLVIWPSRDVPATLTVVGGRPVFQAADSSVRL